MESGAGGEGQSPDCSGVVWDLRFDKDDVHGFRVFLENYQKKGEPIGSPFFEKWWEEDGSVRESHVDAASLFVEEDVAIGESEEGVILAHADVGSGVPFGATLADENVAGNDGFTAELLHAEAFAS